MKTASDVSAVARPTSLQDMVKQAMSSALNKVQATKVAEEARAALSTETIATPEVSAQKTASPSSEYCTKLANALAFMGDEFEKEANQAPGKGPGALEVTEAKDGGGSPGGTNRGTAATVPPTNPPMEKNLKTEAPNLMGSNLATPPGGGGTQPQMGKSAAPISEIRKLASQKKTAEDAINPAKISAAAAVPPDASDATQSKGTLGGNSSLIMSNQSAIDYTKGQAKAPAKADVAKVLDEQPMKDGEVLRAAFENTGKAGTKYAGVSETTKVAAAQALLTRVANSVSE